MSYQPHTDEEYPYPQASLPKNQENPSSLENAPLCDITEVSIRLGFIRKVYSLIACQLLLTTLITILMMLYPTLAFMLNQHIWVQWVDCAVLIVIIIAVICCGFGRKVPVNYILLLIFTLCWSLMVGCVAAVTKPEVVCMAAIECLVVTVSLTLYAMFTKVDFTLLRALLWIILSVLLIMVIFLLFSTCGVVYIIVCGLMVVIYGIYLVMDTQLIMGKHKYKVMVDEYVFAAMIIYTDIIQLFLWLLQMQR